MSPRLPFWSIPPKFGPRRKRVSLGARRHGAQHFFHKKYFGPNDAEATLYVDSSERGLPKGPGVIWPSISPKVFRTQLRRGYPISPLPGIWASGVILAQEGPGVIGPKMFPQKYFGHNDAEATLLVHYPKFGPRA